MAEFTYDDVVNKLRLLKINYIEQHIGSDPSQLTNHLAEFLGYATLLYDHYATVLRKYRKAEATILQEESKYREEQNANIEGRSGKVTVTEVEQRVSVRLSEIRALRDFLETEVKGATLHINGCQSLLKNWSDEAKGIR